MQRRFAVVLFAVVASLGARAADYPAPADGTFVVKDFQFKSGERARGFAFHGERAFAHAKRRAHP